VKAHKLADIERGMGKYCERACYNAARHRRNQRTCTVCGGAFWRLDADMRRGAGAYCSTACYHVSQRGPRVALADRFWEKVDKTDTCWLWTAGRQKATGYGFLGIPPRGTSALAHRVAWYLRTGDWPRLMVCHTCDVRACVRNDEVGTYEVDGVTYRRYGHLFVAAMDANTLDAHAKGRTWNKVSDAQVREIRARFKAGEPNGLLAVAFGLHHSTISDITSGRRRQRAL
jgi:hypothetical protein